MAAYQPLREAIEEADEQDNVPTEIANDEPHRTLQESVSSSRAHCIVSSGLFVNKREELLQACVSLCTLLVLCITETCAATGPIWANTLPTHPPFAIPDAGLALFLRGGTRLADMYNNVQIGTRYGPSVVMRALSSLPQLYCPYVPMMGFAACSVVDNKCPLCVSAAFRHRDVLLFAKVWPFSPRIRSLCFPSLSK